MLLDEQVDVSGVAVTFHWPSTCDGQSAGSVGHFQGALDRATHRQRTNESATETVTGTGRIKLNDREWFRVDSTCPVDVGTAFGATFQNHAFDSRFLKDEGNALVYRKIREEELQV